MNKKVVVIVPTRNSIRTIVKCLKSVVDQSYPCELYVVDNNSSDGTLEIAKKFTKKVFTKGPERSAQRNYAAQKSKSDYILVIDSDMILTKNVVRDCVNLMNEFDALVIEEKFNGEGFWTKCKCLEKSTYFGTGDGEAARFFNRKVFFEAGMYDEGLIGTEDIDIHKKIKRLGKKIGYAKELIFHEDDRLSLRDVLKKRVYYALTLDKYLKQNEEESQSEKKFIRKAYIKNWRKLALDPRHTFGMFFMRILEGFAVYYGLWKSKNAEDAAKDVDIIYSAKK